VRALLTAFAPFRGRASNQSQAVLEHCVRRLTPPWRAELLPVDLGWVRQLAPQRVADPALVAWLALGEAGEDGEPRLELRARNAYDLRDDAESAAGEPPSGAVQPDGPPELAAMLPCADLAAALRARGHALTTSDDAGAHCCNALLYCALRAASVRAPAPWIGFLHLPRRPAEAPQQARLVLDALTWIGAQRAG
jgi:pyroglutamyl-peptidase